LAAIIKEERGKIVNKNKIKANLTCASNSANKNVFFKDLDLTNGINEWDKREG
jgi:hypothetical protein